MQISHFSTHDEEARKPINKAQSRKVDVLSEDERFKIALILSKAAIKAPPN